MLPTSESSALSRVPNDVEDLWPEFGNLTESNAEATGITVVSNDVVSHAKAYVENAAVTCGELSVIALESATVEANIV